MPFTLAALLFLSFFITDSALSDPAIKTLEFWASERKVSELGLNDLKTKSKPMTISFVDPLYKKRKRYEGVDLKAALKEAYGVTWSNATYTDIVLVGPNGVQSVGPLRKLEEGGAYLVYKDLDVADWEPVPNRQEQMPGPFYILWTGREQTIENGYPWQLGLESVKLVTFEEQYTEVLPVGAVEGSPAFQGFEIFKQECIRCHSINKQGGKVGPDLNAPKSVVVYRKDQSMLKEFIRQPSKFRYTNMPDQPHLTDKDLDALLAYFKLKSKQSKP